MPRGFVGPFADPIMIKMVLQQSNDWSIFPPSFEADGLEPGGVGNYEYTTNSETLIWATLGNIGPQAREAISGLHMRWVLRFAMRFFRWYFPIAYYDASEPVATPAHSITLTYSLSTLSPGMNNPGLYVNEYLDNDFRLPKAAAGAGT